MRIHYDINSYRTRIPFKGMSLVLLLTFCSILVSCKKYLDIPRSSGDDVPISTADECQLLLDNYDNMNTGYPYDSNLASDDYYVTDSELSQVDFVDQELYKWNGTIVRESSQWTSTYNKVYNANLVLEAVEKIRKNGGTDAATLNNLRGSALFFRAFAHWQIAQLYCKPYSTPGADSDPGIPLRLTSDMNDKSVRGTVMQTYDRIVQDLEEAAILMTYPSKIASRPNKVAAYAMLARVYLSMQDYVKAGANANLALELKHDLIDFNTLDPAFNNPFGRFNPEVVFHTITASTKILYPDQDGAGLYFARVDPELVNSYATGDLRSKIFLKPNMTTRIDPNTGETYKDVDGNDMYFEDGTYRFAGNYEPTIEPSFFNGLAVDELYLIRAESYARAGNFSAAMTDINTLLASRYAAGTYVNESASTELTALNIILDERRKELLFRGLRWTDLRRLNQDSRFAKTLERKQDGNGAVVATLPANDLRYTLLIPDRVIQFGGIAQNSR